MRSPITQNGRSGPITTVLDDDSRTVSTQFPFGAGWNVQTAAQARDACLLAKADQVQSVHTGDPARCVCELTADLEALRLGVRRALDALDQRGGHGEARDVLADVAQGLRGSDEADH